MPYWIRTAVFDPEMERSTIERHDYQEHQEAIRAMQKMEGCKQSGQLELPVKGFANFQQVPRSPVNNALSPYLAKCICPQPGDWPAHFYMRQVQLYARESGENTSLQHIVPFIGPLHITFN